MFVIQIFTLSTSHIFNFALRSLNPSSFSPLFPLLSLSHSSSLLTLYINKYSPIGTNEKVPQLRRDMPLKKLQVREKNFDLPTSQAHTYTQKTSQPQQSLFKLKIEKCTEVYDFKSQTENKVYVNTLLSLSLLFSPNFAPQTQERAAHTHTCTHTHTHTQSPKSKTSHPP